MLVQPDLASCVEAGVITGSKGQPRVTPVPIPLPEKKKCGCLQATAENIKAVAARSPLRTLQKTVSAPGVQEYVDIIEAGGIPDAIWVDKDIIIDGNHRYLAGLLCNKPASIIPWTAPLTRKQYAIPVRDIEVDLGSWR